MFTPFLSLQQDSYNLNLDHFKKGCHSRENGNPEDFEISEKTGFLLEFIPYLIRGRNDGK